MSYTVKTAEFTNAIESLNAATGKQYRVIKNTEWGTFDLQVKEGRAYIGVFDSTDKEDVISTITGMTEEKEKKTAIAECIAVLEENLQVLEAIEPSDHAHVVQHGGCIGLYLTVADGSERPRGLAHAMKFYRLSSAQYAAQINLNGANEQGKVMIHSEALKQEIEEARKTLATIKAIHKIK